MGQNSHILLRDDPWLPELPHFKLPVEIFIPESLNRVDDLMTEDKKSWNTQLIQSFFPSYVCNLILSLPIFDREHDDLIWNLTVTGEFSIRYAYKINNLERFLLASHLDKKLWLLMWKSSLHELHKMLLWHILNNVIPTRSRLKNLLALTDLTCLLCNSGVDSIQHLLLECPVADLCWRRSQWQISITHFLAGGVVKWIQILLDDENFFPLPVDEKQQMLHCTVIMFEHLWFWRNRIRLGTAIPDWNQVAVHLGKLM